MSFNFVALGDVCNITGGGTPSKTNANFYIGDIPWATVRDMNRDYLENTDFKISKEAVKESSTNIIPKNNVIIATRVGLGKVCILKQDTAINQDLRGVVPKNEKLLDVNYLFYWFKSISKVIIDAGRGATVHGVTLPFIKSLQLPLPSLATQQKIVAKLDAIFAEIDKATVATETNAKNAEALYKSFLIELFTRKSDDSKVFNLSDLCLTLHQGLNTAGEKVKFYDSGFPIIQTRNIDNGIIDVSEKLKFLSNEDWEKYKDKFKPELGDVFFTNIGTIGKTAIVTNVEDYLIHWNIFKIRPKFNLITSKFMKLALDYLTLSGYFSDRQKGGTVEFVTKKMISEVSLSVPLLKSQIELTNKNDSIFEFCEILRESYHKKLNELNMLKQSILQKVFSGELVKE